MFFLSQFFGGEWMYTESDKALSFVQVSQSGGSRFSDPDFRQALAYQAATLTMMILSFFFVVCCLFAEDRSGQLDEIDSHRNEMLTKIESAKDYDEVFVLLDQFSFESGAYVKPKEEVSVKKFIAALGQVKLAGAARVAKVAKNDDDRIKGYELQISGLRDLISVSDGDQYKKQLAVLWAELDKSDVFKVVINRERLQQFYIRASKLSENLTPETFSQFKREVKLLSQLKTGEDPSGLVLWQIRVAESPELLKGNPKIVEETIHETIDFLKSPECIIETKNEIIGNCEGWLRRLNGAEFRLQGRTLDDENFDWDKLSGKVVVVFFTASFCGPCKLETPFLKEAYQKYHDKGLEIITVYILDKYENSRKAVVNEGIPWIVLQEELTDKAGLTPQSKTYFIKQVPKILVIGKDGKILANDLLGQKLKNKLDELFK
jgi:thiol-disulfide isomerase/thioredoxin